MWYTTGLTDSENRYELKRLVGQCYQRVQQSGQSGLIRVDFIINCTGERGQFRLVGLDEEYRPKNFDGQITQQLLAICRDHVPSELFTFVSNQRINAHQDAAVSLTFRLKDGRITDILP